MWNAVPSFHESKQKECITDSVHDTNCLADPCTLLAELKEDKV